MPTDPLIVHAHDIRIERMFMRMLGTEFWLNKASGVSGGDVTRTLQILTQYAIMAVNVLETSFDPTPSL